MPEGAELLHLNLHEVFSERDPGKRRDAIERTYSKDVKFIDPEGEFVGWDALEERAQELLDSAPPGSMLEEDGPQYFGPETAALAWRVGPPGSPIASGLDVLTIRDGRIVMLRTLLAT